MFVKVVICSFVAALVACSSEPVEEPQGVIPRSQVQAMNKTRSVEQNQKQHQEAIHNRIDASQ